MKRNIIQLAIFKAAQSKCVYKIAAIGYNSKMDIIGKSTNKMFICKKGMGKHAEMELMKKFGRKLHTIIICRVNAKNNIMPIDPCKTCKKMADKLGIKILTIKPTIGA